MRLPEPLIPGTLVKRYKRFLADIELKGGKIVTVHCPNSGSMLGLDDSGSRVLLSSSSNPKRKLPLTWELVQVRGSWVLINTIRANQIVQEGIVSGSIRELSGYDHVKPEARWGGATRFDFQLTNDEQECFVEVKSVTLAEGNTALFPDAVTKRGSKHLQELMEVKSDGLRAVLLFLINRQDCSSFKPAQGIDPVFAQNLVEARDAGVEILVYGTRIVPPEISVGQILSCQF